MKLRKLIAITLAVLSVFTFIACGNNQKDKEAKVKTETSEKPIAEAPVGVFITYGEDGAYAFVDMETNSVFTAELPLDHMKDKDGNALKLEDLKDGDRLQFNGKLMMTASIPPMYAGISDVVRLEEGTADIVEKYYPLVEETMGIKADPSMIPTCTIESSQSFGDVAAAIYETSYDWSFETENGGIQHDVVNETEDSVNTVFEMEGSSVEGSISFFPNPTKVELFRYTADGSQEVELTQSGSKYAATLEAGYTYEIQGEWRNGFVTYKFDTKTIE